MFETKMEEFEEISFEDDWQEEPENITYAVFCDTLPRVFYHVFNENFIERLLRGGLDYWTDMVEKAYEHLEYEGECPFTVDDFNISEFIDERGNVITVCVEINAKEDVTKLKTIFIRFKEFQNRAYDKHWSFAIEKDDGDLNCFGVDKHGHIEWCGVIDSQEEADLLDAEYECTMFDYFEIFGM